ncbi:ParA family protein [Priestia endophytica]|uniref:ParA family protein n=1 Tax=Priestia endophytica TaxID=135735 RepID=UPI00124C4B13|nr:ParA family protein [Priestia endophytica]KAB2488089.1 ParA family protein [Priestia endophytica]MCM3541333.1 ParA family protein [Priestia endophytica]
MGKVFSLMQNKGGVLKTTSAVSLASILSQKGRDGYGCRILIIDMDNQGNAAVSFNVNPDKCDNTIYDVLVGGVHPEEAIINVHENIDLLPANDDMQFFEIDLLRDNSKVDQIMFLLKKAIEKIRHNYDAIFIDSPPNMGINIANIINASDYVLIPFNPESFSMRSLMKLFDTLQDFKQKTNPNLEILGVFGTLVRMSTVVHSEILQETRKYTLENNIHMFDTVIPHSIRFATAVAYEGKPAVLTDANNKLVHSYYELYEEMIEALSQRKELV